MSPAHPEPSETNAADPTSVVSAVPPTGEAAAANKALRDRHECSTCGYVYVPLKGDDRTGIAPNTPFDDIPDDWRCPVCNATKRRFQNIGPVGATGFKANAKYGLGVNTMDPGRKNLLIFGTLFLFFLFFLSLYGLQ
jgi:rubredoxin